MVLNTVKLEEILIANWPKFINTNQLTAYVLKLVRDEVRGDVAIDSETKINKALSITVSRFQPGDGGFLVWVDFNVPRGEDVFAQGTTEILLDLSGGINHIRTVGHLLRIR